MNQEPRQALKRLIDQYGVSLCEDPRLCEGLLRDLCGQYKREINVLIGALRAGIVDDLLTVQRNVPFDVVLGRLAKKLDENLALNESAAKWGVVSWALALGITQDDTSHFSVSHLSVGDEQPTATKSVLPHFQAARPIENISRSASLIKVIGVGGAGANMLNRAMEMLAANVKDKVEFIVANTDLQSLKRSRASAKIQLGSRLVKGLGAGANPDTGRNAALESTAEISEVINGADIVFVVAGLSGGTGTGAAPVIASLAIEANALAVAVVTLPFNFEGRRRVAQAEQGLRELIETASTVITISNERLLLAVDRNNSLIDAFKSADDVVSQMILDVSNILTKPNLIGSDLDEMKTVFSQKGMSGMGKGVGRGKNRVPDAIDQAMTSVTFDGSIGEAAGVFACFSGSPNSLTIPEVNEAVSIIQETSKPSATVAFGAVEDSNCGSEFRVTLIATGFQGI